MKGGGRRWSRRCMDLEEGRRLEEGDGAGDVWIWRRDEVWRKVIEQEMYGSGGGMNGGGEGDGAGDVWIWTMDEGWRKTIEQ